MRALEIIQHKRHTETVININAINGVFGQGDSLSVILAGDPQASRPGWGD